jgi:co-chaperonin GroES (HSP10)
MNNEQVNNILDLSTIYQPFRADIVLALPSKEEIEEATKTKGGLIGSKKEKYKDIIYTVLAVGPKCLEIKKWDKVLLRFNQGIPVVNIEGVDYGQVDEFQVLGKIVTNTVSNIKSIVLSNTTTSGTVTTLGNGSNL